VRASAPLIDRFRPLGVTGEIIRGLAAPGAFMTHHIPPMVGARMTMFVKSEVRVGSQYVRGCTTLSVAAMVFVMEAWVTVMELR